MSKTAQAVNRLSGLSGPAGLSLVGTVKQAVALMEAAERAKEEAGVAGALEGAGSKAANGKAAANGHAGRNGKAGAASGKAAPKGKAAAAGPAPSKTVANGG